MGVALLSVSQKISITLRRGEFEKAMTFTSNGSVVVMNMGEEAMLICVISGRDSLSNISLILSKLV